jgi:two-component system, OmpR family, copper resistance phosphate regulon response regulator CusR
MKTMTIPLLDGTVKLPKPPHTMRILLAEDDRRSREFLVKGLKEEGYIVDSAADGEEGLHCALEGEYDLIILDVMMPGRDGWSVISALRTKGNTTPVLFLTARDTVRDRVKGLELGADDYLVKPFAWAEFVARIKTLLRRGPARQAETLRVGDLEIDLPRMKARRGGKVIDLTAKEFQLLSLLARRTGDVLSRTMLAGQVWDMNFSTDSNAVDVALGRLRKKVDDPFPQKLIHTVRGLGYVMEARGHE